MKILVIEDKPIHRQSALETLKGHDLTVVDSYEKGIDAMETKTDYDKLERLATEQFGPCPSETGTARSEWFNKQDELKEQCTSRPEFGAVLVDMMMPMSRETLAPGVFNPGEQVPYGFVLALRACQIGAKYVAVVTDTNHHQGAMSAALDKLGSAYYHGTEPVFEINGAKVLFVHAPFVPEGDGGVKDWGRVLRHLVTGSGEKEQPPRNPDSAPKGGAI